jgi:hypothetical protein
VAPDKTSTPQKRAFDYEPAVWAEPTNNPENHTETDYSVRRSFSDGSTPWRDERSENRAGQQELQGCREAPRAVPAVAVEELPSARAQEGEHVLEVRGGARRGAQRHRIERTSPRGEKQDACETAADLEATRADVLVRQAVAGEVEERPEEERRAP